MHRWLGLLGSWALLVLGLGVFGYAVAAEAITVSDARHLRRIRLVDRAIQEQLKAQIDALQKSMSRKSTEVTSLESEVKSSEKTIEDLQDSKFVITVATAENKVYARENGQLVFEAMCSTGKN